jgi:hypothetical protein
MVSNLASQEKSARSLSICRRQYGECGHHLKLCVGLNPAALGIERDGGGSPAPQ